MNATVGDNGMAERLSGFYPVDLGVTDFQTDHLTERPLIAAGKKAVEEDDSEAIILGCTLD